MTLSLMLRFRAYFLVRNHNLGNYAHKTYKKISYLKYIIGQQWPIVFSPDNTRIKESDVGMLLTEA